MSLTKRMIIACTPIMVVIITELIRAFNRYVHWGFEPVVISIADILWYSLTWAMAANWIIRQYLKEIRYNDAPIWYTITLSVLSPASYFGGKLLPNNPAMLTPCITMLLAVSISYVAYSSLWRMQSTVECKQI
jgi:hypothetical protein